jgi:hypothetical protein
LPPTWNAKPKRFSHRLVSSPESGTKSHSLSFCSENNAHSPIRFTFCSSPSSQCSEHPARSRSISSRLTGFCLRRSTLTVRETPLAPLETWRVASPTPRLNTKAGFINSMSYTNDHEPPSPSQDLFGDVISSYTDAEALEDGTLGELHAGVIFRGLPINRITSHLLES